MALTDMGVSDAILLDTIDKFRHRYQSLIKRTKLDEP